MKDFLHRAIALAGFGLSLWPGGSVAQQSTKPIYAVVPKLVDSPFYAEVLRGATAQADKDGSTLRYVGPQHSDPNEQVAILEDLIKSGVKGIAVSPLNPDSIVSAVTLARRKNIPVVTFDSDAPNSDRVAYVGTNNLAAGHEAGKTFQKLLPQGKYAIITGGMAARNLNERIAGFRQIVQGDKYIETAGSPFLCEDDPHQAVQFVADLIARHPDLNGLFFAGGWPMFLPEDFKKAVASRLDDLHSGKFVIVAFDTLPDQLALLKEGYASALIGQRPGEMGAKSIAMLNDTTHGKKVQSVETGVDVVERANADSFAK
jgi:ribose transport system substrate-binding protein